MLIDFDNFLAKHKNSDTFEFVNLLVFADITKP